MVRHRYHGMINIEGPAAIHIFHYLCNATWLGRWQPYLESQGTLLSPLLVRISLVQISLLRINLVQISLV